MISGFNGLAPRMGDWQLPVGAAREARDLWLSNGGIRPWRTPLTLVDAPEGAVCFHFMGCGVAFWDKVVRATDWIPDGGPIRFVVGRTWRPEILLEDGSYVPLGVDAPETAPSISCTESYGETSDMRSYVYTWVDALGHESAPSPPSRSAPVKDGDPVVVSGLPVLPEGIASLRLYRTATGSRLDDEEKESSGSLTAWLLVAEPSDGETFHVDQLLTRELGARLETEEDRPPPIGMSHILRLPGRGVLAGAAGNRIHFSEDYRPWVWPPVMDLTLPDRIVNLGVLGTTLFATTEGAPAIIDTSECDPASPKAVVEVPAAPPDVGRLHARSAAVTPFGMVYSSVDGLVLLAADGSFRILTASWYDRPTWSVMQPETARMAWWRGRLICATDVDTLVLEIDARTFGDSEAGILTTLSLSPVDMQVAPSGALAMLVDGEVLLFDQGDRLMPWVWESAPLPMGGDATFTAVRVRPSGALVTVEGRPGDAVSVALPDGRPRRLPRLGRSDSFVIRLEGGPPVDRFEIAESLRNLMTE